MSTIPIGLQLYSVREDAARDLGSVLSAVAGMGYEGVEFAGYYGHTADDVKGMLDKCGLNCCGAHVPLDQFTDDRLADTLRYHKAIGCEYLIVPWLPEQHRNSRATWLKTAEMFNRLSHVVKAEGFRIGYHNHHVEFSEMDGEIQWDTFFGNTEPDVIMQFDTGNALVAGADSTPFLRRYPGRSLSVHLKEYSRSNDKALIGEGDVDWPQVLHLCANVGGAKWFIVEQESYAFPPMQCVELCLKNLKRLLSG